MQHLRFLVEYTAYAVAAKLAHHAKALAFGKLLDGITDIAQVDAGTHHFDAVPHGLISDSAQTLGGNRNLAHHEHAAGVAVPAVFDDGDVDIDDIALFQRLVIGNAMADLVVDRGADGFGVGGVAAAFVVERCRDAALHLHNVVMCQLV